jgi:hypothetical protein
MDELVNRLSQGKHPITVGGPRPSLNEFYKRVTEMGYVFLKFTDTRGGTDLGVRIEEDRIDMSRADIEQGVGIAHIEGRLALNFINVRCVADIELATLNGTGHLVVM